MFLRGGQRTENARHDGDTRVLDLALGIVDAQGLERGKTDCLVFAGHGDGLRRGVGDDGGTLGLVRGIG